MKITKLLRLDTGEFRFDIERSVDEIHSIPAPTSAETTSYCTDQHGDGIWDKDDNGWHQIAGAAQFHIPDVGQKGKKAIAKYFGFDLTTGESNS
jgi:hypothetical protein